MNVLKTELPGLLVIETVVHRDQRGYLVESWRQSRYREFGMPQAMVQGNVSFSRRGVLRGMHFQNPSPQAKLLYVLAGEIFDAVVDVRRDSPTFGKWFGLTLSAENAKQLFVPEGFAHGFCVLSESAVVGYYCTAEYVPGAEKSIAWNDPQVAIDWPIADPILSPKDAAAPRLASLNRDELPRFDHG